jgi:Protein of unknown function (DUF3421)
MSKQLFERRSYYTLVAGLVLASNLAFGQNWVSSTSASPVIPFDAPPTGWTNPTSTLPKTPLYTCRGGAAEGLGVQVGKFTPGGSGCEFGYGGKEISVPDFEFLVMSWESAGSGFVPPNAVQGGWDPIVGSVDKLPLYYCRGEIRSGSLQRPPSGPSSLQLGKIRPGFAGCVVPYSGTEFTLGEYEVLVALQPAMPLATVPAINGFVPQDAIRAGTDADGTPLYICSAFFNGGTFPGKLHSSFGGCNISYAGVEHTISSYFVLRPDWLGIPTYDFPAGTDVDGSPLHVCRLFLTTGLYPGKKRQPWTTCNVGLSGIEQTGTNFEILSH